MTRSVGWLEMTSMSFLVAVRLTTIVCNRSSRLSTEHFSNFLNMDI